MKNIYLKTKPLLISVSISISLNVYCESKTTATIPKPVKVSQELLTKNPEHQNLVEEIKQHNTVDC